jgi:hypothetical protein
MFHSITSTADSNEVFTISGLASGTNFSLKISKAGYVPIYSMMISSPSDIGSPADFYLLTPGQLTIFGVSPGKSIIVLRAVDPVAPAPGFMRGVTATYTSSAHPSGPPYAVAYDRVGTIGAPDA